MEIAKDLHNDVDLENISKINESMENHYKMKNKSKIASEAEEIYLTGDSDNDSGFLGASTGSLECLEETSEPEAISQDDDYFEIQDDFDLNTEEDISKKLECPMKSCMTEKDNIAIQDFESAVKIVLGKIEFPKDYEYLTISAKYEWLKETLEKSCRILPHDLLQSLSGFLLPGDCGRAKTDRPSWLDMDKFLRGQKFAQDHLFGVYFAELLSLFALFSFRDGLKPMIVTGKSSTPYTAFRRYLSTGVRIRNWYTEDPWLKGTAAYKDIQTVRRMHSAVRQRLWKINKEDINEEANVPNAWCPTKDILLEDFRSSCPVPSPGQCFWQHCDASSIQFKGLNQSDMSATQFGFVGLIILHPVSFGVHYATDEDLEAFCHVWRGIGYLLGIQDEYNFCRGSLDEIRQRSRDFINFWVKPNLREINPEWEHMLRCILAGLQYYFPGSSYETALMYFTELIEVPMPRLYNSMSYMEWIKHNLNKSLFYFMSRITAVRQLMNKRLNDALDKAVNYDSERHEALKKLSEITLERVAAHL
ncbi:uncharacterized protein LOC107270262 [Cephus cinctus]|uniref:Uncharacterized protein LOC107270262 n=1 Tax=Cephus cinctus TaxID=211228 RepID=A0AAJ7RLZ8_CEPCN|nr:uncharacterized protein LOC107270262 [Cephus cinctus]